MKKIMIVLVTVLMLCGSFVSAVAADKFSVSLNSRFWSKYLFGNGATPCDKPVQHTNLTINFPNNVFVDVWSSFGLTEEINSSYCSEVDYSLGWVGKDLFGSGLDLVVGAMYIDAYELTGPMAGDVIQLWVQVSKTFQLTLNQSVTPFGIMEYYIPVGDLAPEGGGRLFVGATHRLQLLKFLELENRGRFVFDSFDGKTNLGFERAQFYQHDIRLNWGISPNATLEVPAVQFSAPLSRLSKEDPRETEWIFGAGIKFRF